MTARQDNNFLEMIRALPTRATPRIVTLTPDDFAKVEIAASRRRAGKPRGIKDRRVVGQIADLLRTR